jgi:hypothetical protein
MHGLETFFPIGNTVSVDYRLYNIISSVFVLVYFKYLKILRNYKRYEKCKLPIFTQGKIEKMQMKKSTAMEEMPNYQKLLLGNFIHKFFQRTDCCT